MKSLSNLEEKMESLNLVGLNQIGILSEEDSKQIIGSKRIAGDMCAYTQCYYDNNGQDDTAETQSQAGLAE